MVGMELTPLGGVTLWIWVIRLPRPLGGIPYSFHDSYNLHEFDVEVVLWDTGVVSLSCRVIT